MHVLIIEVPRTFENERQYITDVVFREFLGVAVDLVPENRPDVLIYGADGSRLHMSDVFFSMAESEWLTGASLPHTPLDTLDVDDLPFSVTTVERIIPVIFGDKLSGDSYFKLRDGEAWMGLDVLGSSFYMLTRYEEAVRKERDEHGRFPARASLQYAEGFIDRPIVNEYVEILWGCMKCLWPRLRRKERQFQIHVSHDVDSPFLYRNMSFKRLLIHAAGRAVRSRNPLQGLEAIKDWALVRKGLSDDPYDTFSLIMDISEANNLLSTFFFITDHSAGRIDGLYSIDDPAIRMLLRRIHERGHEIGLHCSYGSYRSAEQITKEFKRLLRACDEEGVSQQGWGSRQHYLRWETPTTLRALATAGLDYDTSLSFADHAGFRCGVCYEYPVYDVVKRRRLRLRERPLLVMECSVIDERYMGMGRGEEAQRYITSLVDKCRLFAGDFTLLWHNSRLASQHDLELYRAVCHCNR